MSDVLTELEKLKQASQTQTAASQAIVDEVAGKMGIIEQELVKFQNSFQPNAQNLFQKNFYVDGERGNDSNDGTVSQPLKTLQGMNSQIVSGASYNVYIRGTVELSGDLRLRNNTVFVYKQDVSQSAKIEQKVTGSLQFFNASTKETTDYDTAGSITLQNSVIHFYGVDIETARSKQYPIFFSDSFIARDDRGSGLVGILGNLQEEIAGIERPVITINDATFCSVSIGPDMKNFAFYGAEFIKNGVGDLLKLNGSPALIKTRELRFPDGQTCRDFINGINYDINSNAINIITNNNYLFNKDFTG